MIFSFFTVGVSSLLPFQRFKRYALAGWQELISISLIVLRFGYYRDSEKLRKTSEEIVSSQFRYVASDNIDPQAIPILYAPGYLDTPQTYLTVARRLSQKTSAPIYLLKYRSKFQSIEDHAKDVISLAEKIKKDTHHHKIILIGHSMGGVATGQAIERLEKKEITTIKWITIATPFNGTPLAKIGFGQCARDLEPASKFYQTFKMPKTDALHLQSDVDLIIPLQMLIKFITPQSPLGHLSLRDSYECDSFIVNFITQK